MFKVLIVDENRMYRDMLADRLASFFTVSTATTVREAGPIIDAHDAVLVGVGEPYSDHEMAVLDAKRWGKSAIIVLSQNDNADFIRDSIRHNSANYLIKGRDDQDPQFLASQIRTAIAMNRSRATAGDIGKMRYLTPAMIATLACLMAISTLGSGTPPNITRLFAIDRWIEAIANQ